jgi:hypothetical protein
VKVCQLVASKMARDHAGSGSCGTWHEGPGVRSKVVLNLKMMGHSVAPPRVTRRYSRPFSFSI